MTINIATVFTFTKDLLGSWAKIKGEIDFATKTAALGEAIYALPEFATWEDSAVALVQVEGWSVVRDETTGHVAVLVPPPQPAPARETPQEFNADPRNR